MKIEWTADALDDLEKLDRVIAKRILRKISWLADYFNHIIPEPLSGDFAGAYKLRVGDWRVIYMKEANFLIIHAVGHRRDVYKL